jgi:hypothetical protein
MLSECPEEVNMALILGPIVAAVILIPLLIIFLFIFIRNRRDQREFARFLKEKESARWEAVSKPPCSLFCLRFYMHLFIRTVNILLLQQMMPL